MGVQKDFPTNSMLSKKEYKQFTESDCELTMEMENICHMFKKYFNAVKELEDNDMFSFSNLKETSKLKKSKSLEEVILEYAETRDLSFGAKNIFRTLANKVKLFDNKLTLIKMIDAKWCENFIEFSKKEKNNSNTIRAKIMNLSTVFIYAIKKGYIKQNPILNLNRPQYKRREMDLSSESLHKLLYNPIDGLSELQKRTILLWRTMYFGNGMSLTDILHLTKDNLHENEITYSRRKTRKKTSLEIHIPLIPELKTSLNQLICKDSKSIYLLEELNKVKEKSPQEAHRICRVTSRSNEKLKEICTLWKIKEKVTTYTARHQFATSLLRKGVPIEYISSALGHSNITMTQNYLEGYTKEQREKYAELLRG